MPRYGFIACDETHALYKQDIFVHVKEIQDLEMMESVVFRVKMSAKKQPQAHSVRHTAFNIAATADCRIHSQNMNSLLARCLGHVERRGGWKER